MDDELAVEVSFEAIGDVLTTSGEKLHAKATLPFSLNAQLFQSKLSNTEGSLIVSMPADTELEISDYFTVLVGQVHIKGTGDLLGELLRLSGESFRDNDNPEENFPFIAFK